MSNFLIDEETDLLAAEFVLGTLDAAERANAHELLRTNHAFIAMVKIWERRFGELHLMVEPVDPDPAILRRIKAKVIGLKTAAEAKALSKAAAEIAPPAPPPEPAVPPEPAPAPPPAAAAMPKAANIDLKPLQAIAEAAAAAAPAAIMTPAETPAVEIAPPAVAPAPTPEPPAVMADVATPVPDVIPSPPAAIDVPASAPPATEEPALPPSAAPAMFPPAVLEPAADAVGPGTELSLDIKPEPAARLAGPQLPSLPSAPRLPERFPERIQGRGAERGAPEVTIDVIRSRGRWRAFGILMVILAFALSGLLAAWRFAPDRLPAKLRPREFMAAFGVAPRPAAPKVEAAPARRLPPTGQFDE